MCTSCKNHSVVNFPTNVHLFLSLPPIFMKNMWIYEECTSTMKQSQEAKKSTWFCGFFLPVLEIGGSMRGIWTSQILCLTLMMERKCLSAFSNPCIFGIHGKNIYFCQSPRLILTRNGNCILQKKLIIYPAFTFNLGWNGNYFHNKNLMHEVLLPFCFVPHHWTSTVLWSQILKHVSSTEQ